MIARYAALVAVAAQPDFADAADRGQRRAQLVRHVGGEPPHLLERLPRAAPSVSLNTVASRPISSSGIVHRQPIAQPLGGDRPRALGHPLDRRERAARQRVAAEAGDRDGQRQAEQQDQRQLAQLLPHRRFGARDLDARPARGRQIRPRRLSTRIGAVVGRDRRRSRRRSRRGRVSRGSGSRARLRALR